MRALLVASVVFVAGCPCGVFGGDGCGGPSAQIDTCPMVMPASAQAIEIGHRGAPFRAYRDGERPDIEVGGQGLSMLGFRLRLIGVNEAECIAQSTTTESSYGSDGFFVGRISSDPLRFHKQADGSRVTNDVLLPVAGADRRGDGDGNFVLIAEAAGQMVRVALRY